MVVQTVNWKCFRVALTWTRYSGAGICISSGTQCRWVDVGTIFEAHGRIIRTSVTRNGVYYSACP